MLAMLIVLALALPLGQHLRAVYPAAGPTLPAESSSAPLPDTISLHTAASPAAWRHPQAADTAVVQLPTTVSTIPRRALRRRTVRHPFPLEQPLSLARTEQLRAATEPSLVDLTTALPNGSGKAGTGVVLTSQGLVISNCHVVSGYTQTRDGGDSVRAVDLGDGHTYAVQILGCDHRRDIAVVKLLGAQALPTARLARSGHPHPGMQLASLGNAYGYGPIAINPGPLTGTGWSTTVSAAPARLLTGLLRVDNAIVPGQSGGPLIDSRGRVVGINVAREIGPDRAPTGASYAIPINSALHAAQALLTRRSAHHRDSSPTHRTARSIDPTRGVIRRP
jgi:S1-C subfamily serine protease